MTILVMDWPAYGQHDLIQQLQKMNINVMAFSFDHSQNRDDEAFVAAFTQAMSQVNVDYVFSFNYFPVISNVCQSLGMRYISWVYDSPQTAIYSMSIHNSCNSVFLFDYVTYEELKQKGVQTVHYLPLAVNVERYDRMKTDGLKYDGMKDGVEEEKTSTAQIEKNNIIYQSDISFVGSLYHEKGNMMSYLDSLSDYAKGYLQAVMQAQQKIQGYYFVEELLKEDVLKELQETCPYNTEGTLLSDTYVYAHYFVGRQLANRERTKLLQMLSQKYQVDLYTHQQTPFLPNVMNRGKVDYYTQMPKVFRQSKINLNISLRSIRSGIPLRALDIMGNEGFLLSNYQQELAQYFVPGEEFVYYEDEQDLMDKVAYYLNHEEERKRIAHNGYLKVKQEFSYDVQVRKMFDMLVQHDMC